MSILCQSCKEEKDSMRRRLERMREALKKIRDWNPKQELPHVWEIAKNAIEEDSHEVNNGKE